jgi:hypothetical protein
MPKKFSITALSKQFPLKNDIWENPVEEIMKLEKFQELKKEMMKRDNETLLKEKYFR